MKAVLTILLLISFLGSGVFPAGSTTAGFDKNWLINKFKAFDQGIYQGEGYSQVTNENGALAWAQSYLLEAYLDMYLGTGDPVWIEKFLRQSKRVINATDQARGLQDYLGRSLFGWSSQRYSKPHGWKAGDKPDLTVDNKPRVVLWVHSGMIAFPMAKFALMVQNDPKLAGFADQVAPLLSAAQKAVGVFNHQWRNDPSRSEGYYVYEKNMPVYGIVENQANLRSAINADLAVGKVLAALCLLKREGDYCQKTKALAKKFSNNLILSGNRYIWHYRYKEDRHLTKVMEDLSHGAIDIEFAYACYQAGIQFTRADMQRFANTLLACQKGARFSRFVDGQGDDPQFIYSDNVGRWLDLCTVEPRLYWTVFGYFTQRLGDLQRPHPRVLLGLAKLVRYYDSSQPQRP